MIEATVDAFLDSQGRQGQGHGQTNLQNQFLRNIQKGQTGLDLNAAGLKLLHGTSKALALVIFGGKILDCLKVDERVGATIVPFVIAKKRKEDSSAK
jgi:hypothetical protein